MHFRLTDEQQMIVDTVRAFTEKELMPYEAEVEKAGTVIAAGNPTFSVGAPQTFQGTFRFVF